MKHALFSFAGAVRALPRGVAIVLCSFISLQASAQQTDPAAQPPAAAVAAAPAQAPTAAPGAGALAAPGPAMAAQPGTAQPGTMPAGTPAPAAAAPAPDESNPFSNIKPVDNQALKQELPALENRVKQMESQMSAIQQVGAVLPADALGGSPGRPRVPGQPAPMDDAMMELQASTFVACVNGQALFRDTDQKPFFVDAKEANQNEAVRRIGGCKH